MIKITNYKTNECSCETCKSMCDRPCWPTPDEALLLIEKGYGDKLMKDWWVSDNDIYLLCPACAGYEGRNAPAWPNGKCIFFNDGCYIHNIKPSEGKIANCKHTPENLHKEIAMLWNNPEAQKIVSNWESIYAF